MKNANGYTKVHRFELRRKIWRHHQWLIIAVIHKALRVSLRTVMGPAPSWLDKSIGRVLHQYRRGYGWHPFKPAFFQAFISHWKLLKLRLWLPWSIHQIDVSFSCVCPVIDHEFRPNIVKVAVDSRGDSRVDPQTRLTMLWRNSLSITGQTHYKLTSICFLR